VKRYANTICTWKYRADIIQKYAWFSKENAHLRSLLFNLEVNYNNNKSLNHVENDILSYHVAYLENCILTFYIIFNNIK
jgi:hypothetical protein